MVTEQSHSSISKVIEVGCICNDAEITPDGLHGQPTEGALIAAAWKVTNYFTYGILVLSVLDNITNLFVLFLYAYNFVYIILSYVFLHLHTIPMYASIIFHSKSMIFMCANF